MHLIKAVLEAKTEKERLDALENIDSSTKRAAREVQDFLPESAFLSKEIALTFHRASTKNFQCRFHTKNRGHTQHDAIGVFVGVGYGKQLSQTAPPNHMHCGCEINDILLEYYIWKTLTTVSSNPSFSNTKYPMNDDDILHPRIRRFWIHLWKEFTGLTIDDIYGEDAGTSGWIKRLGARSMVMQAMRLTVEGHPLSLKHPTPQHAQDFLTLLGAPIAATTPNQSYETFLSLIGAPIVASTTSPNETELISRGE